MPHETVTVTKDALDALRDERNEISRDYRKLAAEAETLRQTVANFAAINAERNAELETTRRQRDEALQVLRQIAMFVDGGVTIKETAQAAWDLSVVARRILTQYTEDAE